jgi:PAS domain-containing protein
MNIELLSDIYYAAPELFFVVLMIMVFTIGIIIFSFIKIYKLRKDNYYLKRDKERYSEILYASKDGYFAFIYPDYKLEGPPETIVERCSRRLAVILNLPNGTMSAITEVLKNFYKDDVEKISKYITLLCDDGVSFEDQFVIKNGKILNLNGVRISGIDGKVYSDIIWFRDISGNADYINTLMHEKELLQTRARNFEDLIDNLPYPVWMRNHSLNVVAVNKKYLDFSKCGDKDTVVINNVEISGFSDDIKPKDIARKSRDSNKVQSQTINITFGGERLCYKIIETPFLSEGSLDKIATVGAMVDISDLANLKRNLKQYQSAHLEILNSLKTAFAVFNNSYKLDFYNPAFLDFWGLGDLWLDAQPAYVNFLDILREKRLLPEVPDYPHYRNEEIKAFNEIMEPKEDLLHLPDGRSIRRIRAPLPKGGLIFAFEDISDRLAAHREYNSIVSVQQEILDSVDDAILIFTSNGRLKFYNKSYINLWDADEVILSKEPTFSDLLETQKSFFSNVSDWDILKKDITNHIFSSKTKTFTITRADNVSVEFISILLSNESIMLLMRKS